LHITVQRQSLKDDRTLGEMIIDGAHFCWTIEDAVRDRKVPNDTAIPTGVYEVVVNWSQRFGKALPLLMNVPGFTGVRFHGGNGPDDTEGCILVGARHDEERIWDCATTASMLTFQIRNACSSGKVFVEVLNPQS
jgi:hypothetical protein